MANGYPDNQACWDVANGPPGAPPNSGLRPAPPGAILVFAYAAAHQALPPDPATFTSWAISQVWNVAAGVKIDASYIAGYWQTFGSAPDLADAEQAFWFHWYQAAVGYPGSTPGPGDGYLGNTLGSTDPRLRFVTAAGPAPHGVPDLTQAVAFGAAPAALAGPLPATVGGTTSAGAGAGTAGSGPAANAPLAWIETHPLEAAGLGLGGLVLLRLLLR